MKQFAHARELGIMSEITYQFCAFLKRIDPGCHDDVLLAACLASARKEEGDVCVELGREAGTELFAGNGNVGIRAPEIGAWIEKLESSECVGRPGDAKPLILDSTNRLYLHKYWKFEEELANDLISKAFHGEAAIHNEIVRDRLNQLFGNDDEDPDWQKVAAYLATQKKLTVISGGPGTGKTSTVVKILVLLAQTDQIRRAALAAPTGKAAARLKESINRTLVKLKPEEAIREKIPDEAYTIHKLLGAGRQRTGFRFNRENPLPYDVVVIDEASMVDLALMHKLMGALPKKTKLILLGDKDQLASVEAGAVLGSICIQNENSFSQAFIDRAQRAGIKLPENSAVENLQKLTDHIVLLKKNYRFKGDSGIGNLARHILEGDDQKAIEVLEDGSYPDVELKQYKDSAEFYGLLIAVLKGYFDELSKNSGLQRAIQLITKFGVLSVHRRGILGSEYLNRLIERLLREQKMIPSDGEWYNGKPVMVTRNNYSLGLHNGDLGITLQNEAGELQVHFPDDEQSYKTFYPSRLSSVETAYAMTVHKSQGSEFDNVTIILPGDLSPISTRELLYTGVTRARNSCLIAGKPDVFKNSIGQKANRSSGLRDKLWNNLM